MSDNIAFNEISKRVDSNEKDIGILREKSHDIRNKLNQHENVIDRQGDVLEGMIERQDRLFERVTRVEITSEPLNIIRKSWRFFLVTFSVCAILGMYFGSDVHKIIDIIKLMI